MYKIAIVCLPGVFDSAVHIVRDVLAAGRSLVTTKTSSVDTVSTDGKAVATASGQLLVPDRKLGNRTYNLIVVPGIAVSGPDDLIHAIETDPAIPKVVSWIAKHHKKGSEIAAACTGTWIVAETGLLEGRKATTTWHLATFFSKRYPSVDLNLSKMMTHDGGIHCAGAVMAHMDLALYITSVACGAEIARRVASRLLIDQRPSQARYMVTSFMDDASEDFQKIDTWIRDHIQDAFTISDLAQGVGTICSNTRATRKGIDRRNPRCIGPTNSSRARNLLARGPRRYRFPRSPAASDTRSLRRFAVSFRKHTQRTPSSFR